MSFEYNARLFALKNITQILLLEFIGKKWLKGQNLFATNTVYLKNNTKRKIPAHFFIDIKNFKYNSRMEHCKNISGKKYGQTGKQINISSMFFKVCL